MRYFSSTTRLFDRSNETDAKATRCKEYKATGSERALLGADGGASEMAGLGRGLRPGSGDPEVL